MTYIEQARAEYETCIPVGCRIVALSLVTHALSISAAATYFPGITYYQFTSSRKHAKFFGLGKPKPPTQIQRCRWDNKRLESLIGFVASPAISCQIPEGTKTATMSTGEKKIIPNLMRLLPGARIAKEYNELMDHTNRAALKWSESCIISILKCIPATKMKVIQGLDYFTHGGLEAIDNLVTIVEMLRDTGKLAVDFAKSLIQRTVQVRQYLTVGLKLHVKKTSRIPDHCLTYALSDPSDVAFRGTCTDHIHDYRCQNCEEIHAVALTIRGIVDRATFPTAEGPEDQRRKEQLFYTIDSATCLCPRV